MVDTLDDITASLQNYVVAPLAAFGLAGFVFDTEGEAIANLSAEITDHYTEDNKAVQDHIAIRPKKITLKGYVGELVYSPGGDSPQALQQLTQKLVVLTGYLPVLSSAATQLQQTIQAPSNSSITLPDAANIYGLVKNMFGAVGNTAKQQNAFNYFRSLQTQKVLMGVQTPWAFLTNMAIETIVVVQEEDTIFKSDFSITLKEIRIAQTLTTAYSGAQSLQGAAGVQAQTPVTTGNSPGVALPSSSLPGDQSQIIGADSCFTIPGINSLFNYSVH
jgi:hypothetical protein